jgi:lysophospholipase L1-like esterase
MPRVTRILARSLLIATLATAAAATAETRLDMNIGGQTLSRTQSDRTEWIYQWPAVYFEAHFRGDTVSLAFDDPSNHLNIIVDDRMLMTVKKPGRTTLTLDHLGQTPHTIRLEKRTETRDSTGAFAGLFVPSEADALPATPRSRRITFIGDSLTVGYGNTSAFTMCTTEEVFETTDAQEAFGPVIAKHFNADYQIDAFSGLGMVRNYGGYEYPEYRMPMLYPRAIFTDSAPDRAPWSPQIIVIGIGGNDFSPFHPGKEAWASQADMIADYQKTYVAFVKKLRADNPHALILMTWTSDFNPDYSRAAQRVFDTLRTDGVTNLDHLVFPTMERTGCDHHPNVHDDAHVAELFEAWIDAHPGIWQGN